MRGIKLLAIALLLCFAGFVYAAGNAQETKKSCCADKADCCAADCCKADGNSCCKAHNMGNKPSAGAQTSNQEKQAACCNGECCKDGKSCCTDGGCKMDKSGKTDAKAMNCDRDKEGGCCSQGCSKEKAKTE